MRPGRHIVALRGGPIGAIAERHASHPEATAVSSPTRDWIKSTTRTRLGWFGSVDRHKLRSLIVEQVPCVSHYCILAESKSLEMLGR